MALEMWENPLGKQQLTKKPMGPCASKPPPSACDFPTPSSVDGGEVKTSKEDTDGTHAKHENVQIDDALKSGAVQPTGGDDGVFDLLAHELKRIAKIKVQDQRHSQYCSRFAEDPAGVHYVNTVDESIRPLIEAINRNPHVATTRSRAGYFPPLCPGRVLFLTVPFEGERDDSQVWCSEDFLRRRKRHWRRSCGVRFRASVDCNSDDSDSDSDDIDLTPLYAFQGTHCVSPRAPFMDFSVTSSGTDWTKDLQLSSADLFRRMKVGGHCEQSTLSLRYDKWYKEMHARGEFYSERRPTDWSYFYTDQYRGGSCVRRLFEEPCFAEFWHVFVEVWNRHWGNDYPLVEPHLNMRDLPNTEVGLTMDLFFGVHMFQIEMKREDNGSEPSDSSKAASKLKLREAFAQDRIERVRRSARKREALDCWRCRRHRLNKQQSPPKSSSDDGKEGAVAYVSPTATDDDVYSAISGVTGVVLEAGDNNQDNDDNGGQAEEEEDNNGGDDSDYSTSSYSSISDRRVFRWLETDLFSTGATNRRITTKFDPCNRYRFFWKWRF